MTQTVVADPAGVDEWPLGDVFRDITRGGLVGLLVGVGLGGLGGRIAMRLAALIVPDAAGAFTQNGNRIGDITLGGSLGLIVAVGLFVGAFVGTLWVVIRPWLPDNLALRALAAIPIAIALGSIGVVEANNPDFVILGHDPLVVGVLLVLVGAIGPAAAVVDAWLDRRLVRVSSGKSGRASIYSGISVIGMFLILPLIAVTYLSAQPPVGIALLVTGLATLSWWILRYRGTQRPPTMLRVVGGVGVLAATLLGLAFVAPEIRGALGAG